MTLSIAFNGAFFAWPYQAGVASYVQEHGLLDDKSRVYGTSSGAVVAVMLAAGVDIAGVGLTAGLVANARAMGEGRTPFFRSAAVIPTYFAVFGPVLPGEAHVRASGRLHVAITQVPRFKKRLVSDYPTHASLLDALAASIAIPGVTVPFAHKSPRFGWCLDGGPEIGDDDRPGVDTLRVGVGPRLPRGRFDHVMPSEPVGFQQRFLIAPEAQRRELFQLGYRDAKAYLRERVVRSA
jgi:hypothetical protein